MNVRTTVTEILSVAALVALGSPTAAGSGQASGVMREVKGSGCIGAPKPGKFTVNVSVCVGRGGELYTPSGRPGRIDFHEYQAEYVRLGRTTEVKCLDSGHLDATVPVVYRIDSSPSGVQTIEQFNAGSLKVTRPAICGGEQGGALTATITPTMFEIACGSASYTGTPSPAITFTGPRTVRADVCPR